MSNPQTITHRIDGDDVIRHVDDVWVAFAVENGALNLTRERVLGHSLFDFIKGADVRHVTALLIARVRTHRVSVEVPVRCDSPTKRRFISLSLKPLTPAGIEFSSHVVREEIRTAIGLLDDSVPRSDEFVRVCSWCKRIYVDGLGWAEIETAIASHGLFGAAPLPQLTHGMCESCMALIQSSRA